MSLFNLAGVYADIVHALCIIESNENSTVDGDGERARGLLQQHPALFAEYYGRALAFPRSVHHAWSEAEIVTAASFIDIWQEALRGLDAAVVAYNVGISGYQKGSRNDEYLSRFSVAYQAVRSGAHDKLCKLK